MTDNELEAKLAEMLTSDRPSETFASLPLEAQRRVIEIAHDRISFHRELVAADEAFYDGEFHRRSL